MTRRGRITGATSLLLAALLSGCATASSPWAQHEARAELKETFMRPGSVCPVIVENETEAMLDASYEVVGMRFDLGLLPSGQTAEFQVQCRAGRVRATAVSRSVGLDEPELRFQKMARLDLSRITRLQLTQADRVH